MILFGGWVSGPSEPYPPAYHISDETWALDFGDAAWDSLALEERPGGRQKFVAVVDRGRSKMVISGGESWESGHDLGDTWALDLDGPPRWTRLETTGTGPGAIAWHAGDFLPERGSLIQYGGTWTAAQNQGFELQLDSGTWSQIQPPGPDPAPARRGGAMLLEGTSSSEFRLWGGYWWHDLWGFQSSPTPTWQHLPTTGIAPTAGAPNFVYDSKRRRLIAIAGGNLLNHGHKLNQIWAMPLDGPSVWSQLAVAGDPPIGRSSFGAAYDPLRDRVLLYGGINFGFGGSRQANDIGELWELSLSEPRWHLLQTLGAPGKRGGPQVIYDPPRDRLLVLGGFTSGYDMSYPVHDTWALTLAGDSLVWSSLGPPVPGDAQIVMDSVRDRLVAWTGGAEAWALPLDQVADWQGLVASGEAPTQRSDAGVRYDPVGDRLLVFGGDVPGGFPSPSPAGDLFALHFSTPVAVDIRPGDGGEVAPRRSHGLLEAAVLASATFSPESVLAGSVTLAGAHALDTSRGRGHYRWRDVNRDGRLDLIMRFPVDSMRLSPRDSVVVLRGDTPHFEIMGRASVQSGRKAWGPQPTEAPPDRTAESSTPVLALSALSPSTTGLVVRCVLTASASAHLDVFDIAGRRVANRDLRGLPPGEHWIELDPGDLKPGVFLLRLTQGGRALTTRAVVLR
jgi:hypothetical protein